MSKLIPFLILLAFEVSAGTSKILQELVTVGMKSLEGQNIIVNAIRRPRFKLLDRGSLADSLDSSSTGELALARFIRDPSVEKESRDSIVEILSDSPRSERLTLELFHDFATKLDPIQFMGVDLSGGAFERINLPKVTLVNTKLDGVDMNKANLFRAKLNGVSFAHANLSEANIRKADLAEVNFNGAILSGADLRGRNLKLAKLSGALYDSKTVLPAFFNPKGHNMFSLGGKQHDRLAYFLFAKNNQSLLLQCGMGLGLGAMAAFVSSFDNYVIWHEGEQSVKIFTFVAAATTLGAVMIVNTIVDKNTKTPSSGTRVGTAFLCVVASGVATGELL